MIHFFRKILLLGTLSFSALMCFAINASSPLREFRSAWVASVWNIDWPSKPSLSVSQLKSEFRNILNVAQDTGLNAIILQIRPEGDAFYKSDLEPWSYWLSGKQGRAPGISFDPLKFAVEESHKRGMELHAWFNPFRARSTKKYSIDARHISKKHPEWIMPAGDYLWVDPGFPEAREYTLRVFEDVLRRYDVDGIHIDDYFYPYPKKTTGGMPIDSFDDQASYSRYLVGGGTLERGAWRRENINSFVRGLYERIKLIKPHVKFGISPFGIYRPGIPDSIEAGIDPYVHLATNTKLWINQGWLDYFTPQLYWRIDQTPQSFTTLVKWWASQNLLGRHLWPGIASSRILGTGGNAQRRAQETLDQIDQSRLFAGTGEGSGHIQWSMKALMEDRDQLRSKLKSGPFKETALVPETPWVNRQVAKGQIPKPRITTWKSLLKTELRVKEYSPKIRWWLLKKRNVSDSKQFQYEVHFHKKTKFILENQYQELYLLGLDGSGKIFDWNLRVR